LTLARSFFVRLLLTTAAIAKSFEVLSWNVEGDGADSPLIEK
jgi:hypothetical protein